MPIEAVKIPQNVYVEDRIIGPITLKQLFITGIGVGIGYMCYAIAIKAGVRNIAILAVCWIPAVIAAAFAFLKINDLSLLSIILLFIESFNKPSQRYWSSHQGLSINLITRQATQEMADEHKKVVNNANRLADLTRQMEKRQEAMNQMSLHDMPNPNSVEAVKTQLQTIEAASPVDTLSGISKHQEADPLPVNQNRVQVSGLDQRVSIDGIASDISRYEHLIAKAA